VVKTFRDKGFAPEKLFRHIYGYDEKKFFPDGGPRGPKRGLTMISVGVCAVRKGLHFALEAWLKSSAARDGTFLIAGGFIPGYAEKLSSMLSHPSVKVLGHRTDVAELMRKSDLLVLPSIEEGFGLVVAEAMGSGCVPLISDACTDICKDLQHGRIHHVGDVETLSRQITELDQDRPLLEKLREASIRAIPEITWTAAGVRLVEAYRAVLSRNIRRV
jgi:glycosyltransferase involved in cell wall biosynthesis